MKIINFVALLIFGFLELNAQKVDIDNFYVDISNCSLPLNYIEPEKRSFQVFLTGNNKFVGADKEGEIKIYGWSKVSSEENPTLDIKVDVGYFNFGTPNSSSRIEEKKDKDGKVVGRTTYYQTTVSNWSRGTVLVNGIKNEMPLPKKQQKETKSDKKKQEKEKELASNPFLKNVDLTAVKEGNPSEKSEVYSYSLDKEYTYSSGEHSSASAAYKAYSNNVGNIRNGHESEFRENYIRWVNSFVNSKYGYAPVNHRARFKKVDSKKHPEYQMFESAMAALKEIFKKMRYNLHPEDIKNDLIPIVQYFDKVTKKYSGDDKDNIKLRGAALYNQARINQFLDNHDKVVELATQMIGTGNKNEKAAEKFIDASNELKSKLAFHNMTSRHLGNVVSTSEDDLGEKLEDTEDD